MKLLIVTNLFPTPIDPERGVFTLQLVKKLINHCEVTIVCPLPWFPSQKFLQLEKYAQYSLVPKQYEIDGIEVHCPKYPYIPKISENYHALLISVGIRGLIQKMHKEKGFDAVNSQWLYPDSVATDIVFKDMSVPHIATGLGCDINHDIYQPVKGRLILDALERCQAITVVSNNLKRELLNHGIDEQKIFVIPNGIDMGSFKILDKVECRKKLAIDSNLPMALYVGRLSFEKNVATLIEAISILKQKKVSIQLYIVGDGPLISQLKISVQKSGLGSIVKFVGKVPHDQVSLWMGATDYFCLPSLREGCPNVILEALGCGKPVIASRVGAIPDVVTKDSGILFTPEKACEISESLQTAIKTDWSTRKISRSVSNLSWDNAAKRYFEVFQETIKLSEVQA